MNFNRTFRLKQGVNTLAGTGSATRIVLHNRVKDVIGDDLDALYHRKGLALKVFPKGKYPMGMNMYETFWCNEGSGRLVDSTKIQNLMAAYGLAPRVYDLIWLVDENCKYAAQVIEYIDKPEGLPQVNMVKEIAEKYGIYVEDLHDYNFVGDKLVDFQGYGFNHYEGENRVKTKARVVEEISKLLWFGRKEDGSYQSAEELQFEGARDNLIRDKLIKFEGKDFTVLDFGCNGSYFLRRAFDAGASYGVGVDVASVAMGARILNTYLGYFNADFTDKIPDKEYDVVLFLSMADHYPLKKIIPFVKHTLYFEGHAHKGYSPQECMDLLKPYFKRVELMGSSRQPNQVERVIVKGVK